MTYQWDNKKPTAQMLGRWQPFHDGHYALFEEIIKKTGQVCIQIRDVQGVDDNPFDFETVKKKIEERLNPKYEGRFKIMLVPNITNICYGRGVGYKIEEIIMPEEIQKISATKIRAGADRERTVILANAYRESQTIRGEGDATSANIYASAYNQDQEFYSFYRSIQAYKNSIGTSNDILVLDGEGDFFKYLNDQLPED